MEIQIVRNVLEANDRIAAKLRNEFSARGILVLNLISSPGSGKTSVLERTLSDLSGEFRMAVIEGDLQTDNDARRIAASGTPAVQINTEGGCHLNSSMIAEALQSIPLEGLDILFIENVGNLVCPTEFDCGEDAKIALISVTEGDDKPQKYPYLFHKAKVMLLNKIDLLPYVDFDVQKACAHASALNADLTVVTLSCREHIGFDAWYQWLRAAVTAKKEASHA